MNLQGPVPVYRVTGSLRDCVWSFPCRKYILTELPLLTESIPSASYPCPPSLESVSVITGIREGITS